MVNTGNVALGILVAIYLLGYALSLNLGIRTWGVTHWYGYVGVAVVCLFWPVGPRLIS